MRHWPPIMSKGKEQWARTDQETLERPPGPRASHRALTVALTILHHADPSRIGERFVFDPAAGPVALGRFSPAFRAPSASGETPLSDPFISRRASVLVASADGSLRWIRDEHGSGMVADGVPVTDAVRFDEAHLAKGVVLELAQRAVLLLHTFEASSFDGPSFGLVGESDSIERVREAIAQVAELPVPVLIRGESGTGKEVVARAIHEASGRAGPLVSLNMAAVAPTVAASELFGHVRGAFTGAVRDHAGSFRAADTGTLFLDEVGDTPLDVQPMLLRALETSEVQPVGGTRTVKVDVRLITATDVDLESAVSGGRFRGSLLHRLAGVQIALPPLRERRDDIARLLLHFLRLELESLGIADRLEARDPEAPPWLSAELVARLVRYPWPGNVRQLRNVARQIVLASRNEPHARFDASVELAMAQPSEPAHATSVTVAPAAPAPAPVRKPSDIGAEELRAALEACGWKLGPTAEHLGIRRSSLYDLIDRTPGFRRARDVTREELESAMTAVGSTVEDLARQLCVSPRAIKLRMKELGL